MKVPNILTVSRFLLAPVFIVFFLFNTTWSLVVCIIIAAIIELTDFLDGRLARRNKQITDFGKLMDPFADSVSRFSIFISFLSAGLAPVWIIIIFFYRDTLVSVVRVFSMKEGVVVAARQSGKTKAWVQASAIFLVLFILLFQKEGVLPSLFADPNHIIWTTAIIAIAAVVTLWSAIDYWKANKEVVYLAMRVRDKNENPQ